MDDQWARYVAGENAVALSSLAVGEQFRFPKSENVFTKLAATRYRDTAGKKWMTGARTAVIRVPRESEFQTTTVPPSHEEA